MKGYLHNLLMRSMGAARTVQPRVASLFEPPVTTRLTPQPEQQLYVPQAEPLRERFEDERSAPLSSPEVMRPAPFETEHKPSLKASLSTTPAADDAPRSPESERPSSQRIFVERRHTKSTDTHHGDASLKTHETVVPTLSPPALEVKESHAESVEAQHTTPKESSVESVKPPPSLLAHASKPAHAPLPAETIRVPERATLAPLLQSREEARATAHSVDEKEETRASLREQAAVERARSTHEETKTVIREVSQRTVERELLIEKPRALSAPDEHSTMLEISPQRHAPPPLRPRVSPRVEERRTLLDETQSESAPEPVIHVSIGRIEVRAVAKEARATHQQRAVAAKHAESLEDYLRQRAKGGGR